MLRTRSLRNLEKLMTWLYEVRLWFTRAARLGQLMARGGYLIGERQRLFVKLGEVVYEKTQQGALNPAELEFLVHQIDRLTKKLEIEEMLIRSLRFATLGEPECQEYDELRREVFEGISNWYYYAILSLGSISPNDARPAWIANRLGISRKTAQIAFDRLFKLGLIKRKGAGFYQSSKPLTISSKERFPPLRNLHRQNLWKAMQSLDNDETKVRDFSCVTMAIDPDDIEEARELIKVFRRKFTTRMESGRRRQVYTLSLQFFPISKNSRRSK